MIMIKYLLFNFCVIVSFFYLSTSISCLNRTFLTNSSYKVFLTIPVFTASLRLLKSTGVVSNSSISNLSIFNFKLAKSAFLANFDVSTPVAFF